MPLNLWKYM